MQPIPSAQSASDSGDAATDAQQYLAAVSAQARALPNVFVSDVVPAVGSGSSTVGAKDPMEEAAGGTVGCISVLFGRASNVRHELPGCPVNPRFRVDRERAGGCILPSFEQARKYIHGAREAEAASEGLSKRRAVLVPPLKDGDGWMDFCLGPLPEEEPDEPHYEMSDDDDEYYDEPKEEAEWRRGVPPAGHSPGVRLVLQFDQVCVRRVLSHFASALEGTGDDAVTYPRDLSGAAGAWIYALLAALELPLHRDEGWMMRRLLRACCGIREWLEGDAPPPPADTDMVSWWGEGKGDAEQRLDEHISVVNTIIVVLVSFFCQGPVSAIGYADEKADEEKNLKSL